MATHFNIPAWRISMDREAWWAKVHGVTKRLSLPVKMGCRKKRTKSMKRWCSEIGRKQRKVIPEKGETGEVSPQSPGGEGHQVEPGRLSEFTRRCWEDEEVRRAGVLWAENQRGKSTDRTQNLQRAPSPQLAECWSASTYDETTWGQENNHQKGLQRTAASAHMGPAIIRTEKLEPLYLYHISWDGGGGGGME